MSQQKIVDGARKPAKRLLATGRKINGTWEVRTFLRLGAANANADADARFRNEPVEAMSFADASFDVVISSAVLHFAADERQWHAMMREMWRVLAPGGLFFARLATSVGHESQVRPLGNRRFIMPDGDERFLVDESFILASMNDLGGTLVDPIKTSVVHGKRSMMTWVMRRS